MGNKESNNKVFEKRMSCLVCNKEIEKQTKNNNKIYCSVNCRLKEKYKRKIERIAKPKAFAKFR